MGLEPDDDLKKVGHLKLSIESVKLFPRILPLGESCVEPHIWLWALKSPRIIMLHIYVEGERYRVRMVIFLYR